MFPYCSSVFPRTGGLVTGIGVTNLRLVAPQVNLDFTHTKMILRLVTIVGLLASLALFLLSIIIGAWPCGGLFRDCQYGNGTSEEGTYNYHVIGGLLIVAAITTFVSLAFTLLAIPFEQNWIRIVSFVFCFIGFVMGITAEIFFYTRIRYDWSAFISTVGMTLCFQVFSVQVGHLITTKFSKIEHFSPEFM